MSFESDQRVVELQFNNKQFEADVSTTISTLDKLQNKLRFDGVSKGFDELERASRKVSFEGLMESVNKIAERFTLKGTVIHKFFDDIANRVLTFEKQLERIGWSMTGLEQATAGWDKYAQKTSGVQTIMGAVANEIEDVGDRMAYVNDQLESLNWFTDETSYNFLDMVNNIGKFTANQVPLDMAVESMQGIATWAAKSGASVTEAGRAMYNLSQAISSGALKLLDWKSIELANMGTAEFKQTAIDTAEAMGMLQRVTEDVWMTVDGTEVSVKSFRESLQSGWLSSEVLLGTLNKYGGFATRLNQVYKETGLYTSSLLEAIDDYQNGVFRAEDYMDRTSVSAERLNELISELADSQYDFGRSAFAAAQEAKTFQEAVDSVKDAVSTGWMNSFEIVFGDYMEAKTLWTDFAEFLYGIFAESAEYRNQMLKDWKEVGGRDDLIAGFQNLATALRGIFGAIGDAWRNLFPETTWYDLVQLTRRFRIFTESLILGEDALIGVRKTFTKIFKPIKAVASVFKTVATVILALGLAIKDSVVNLFNFIGETESLGDLFSRLASRSKLLEAVFGLLYVALSALGKVFDFIIKILGNFNSALQKVTGTKTFLGALETIVSYILGTFSGAIGRIIDVLGNCFSFMSTHVFTAQNMATAFSLIGSAVNFISEAMRNAFSWCGNLFNGFGTIKSQEKKIIESTGEATEKFSLLQNVFENIKNGFDTVGKVISDLIKTIFSRENSKKISNLSESLGSFFGRLNTGKIVALGVAVSMFVLLKSINTLLNTVSGFVKSLTSFGDVFKSVVGYFNALTKATKYSSLLQIGAGIMEIAAALWIVSKIPKEQLWDTVKALTTMVVIAAAFAGAMTMIASTTGEMIKAATAIAFLGAGLLVFILAFKQVQSLELVKWQDVVNMLTLILWFTTSIIALGNFVPKFKTGASSMIGFAISIYIMATALKKIADASKDLDENRIWSLIGIITAYSIAMALLGKTNATAGAGVLLSIASILLFIKALEKLDDLKIDDIKSFIAKFATLAVSFAGIVVALHFLKGPIIAAAGGLAIAVGALYGVFFLLDQVANWELEITDKFLKNAATLATAGLAVAFVIGKLSQIMPSGWNINASLGSMLGFSLTILSIAGALKILSGMNWDEIKAGAKGLSLTLLAFGAAALLASRFNASTRSLVAMAIDIGVIVASLTVLSLLGDDVYPAAKSLSLTLVALAAAFFGAGKLSSQANGKAITAMVIDVVAIAGSIILITKYAKDWQTVAFAAAGLGGAIVALGASMNLIGQYNWKVIDLLAVLAAAGIAVSVGYALKMFVESTGGHSWGEILAATLGFALAVAALGGAVALMGTTSHWYTVLAGCLSGAFLAGKIASALSIMAQYSDGLPEATTAFAISVGILSAAVAILGSMQTIALIGAGVLDLIGLAVLAFGTGIDKFGEGVSKFAVGVESISESISKIGSLSSTDIVTAITNISDFGLKLVEAVNDINPKLETAMYNSAGYMIRGLQNGIADRQKEINALGAGLFLTFQSAFEREAQINSPSVAMWKDGQYLIYGIINGIVENVGALYQAEHGIWIYAHDGVKDEVSQIGEEDGYLYVEGVSYKIESSESEVENALRNLAVQAASDNVDKAAYASGSEIGANMANGIKDEVGKGLNQLESMLRSSSVGKYYRRLTTPEPVFLSKEDELNYKGMRQYRATKEQAAAAIGYDPYDKMSVLLAKSGLGSSGSSASNWFSNAASGLEDYGDAAAYASDNLGGVGKGSSAAADSAIEVAEETDNITESLEELLDVFTYASSSVQYFYDQSDSLLKLYDKTTPWNNAISSTEGLILEHYKLLNLYDEEIQGIQNFGDMNKQQAKEAKDAWVEYYDSISSSISQGFGGVFTAPSFSQKSLDVETTSFKTMMSNLDAQERQMTYFTNTLIKLKREGLNEVYLQGLLEAGPENLDEIISWDQLTAEEIKKINAQYEKLQNATSKLTMDYIVATSEKFGTLPESIEESIRNGITNMSTYDIQKEVYTRSMDILQEVLNADGDWEKYNGTRLGELLSEGLADGIKSTTDVAVEAVTALAREMIAKLNSEVQDAKAKQMAIMTSEWTSYVTARNENGQFIYTPSAQESETIKNLKNAVGYLNYRMGSNNYDPDSKALYERWESEGKDAAGYARELSSTLDQSIIKSNLAASELAGQMYAGQINVNRVAKGMEPIYGSEVKGSMSEGYTVQITQNNYSSENLNAEKLEENLRSVAAGISN